MGLLSIDWFATLIWIICVLMHENKKTNATNSNRQMHELTQKKKTKWNDLAKNVEENEKENSKNIGSIWQGLTVEDAAATFSFFVFTTIENDHKKQIIIKWFGKQWFRALWECLLIKFDYLLTFKDAPHWIT